jgi:predicted DNA-binding antitoxin AbrB/MazE fold protein
MSKRRDVIYENGVFRPLQPVDVPEHQRMTITCSVLQTAAPETANKGHFRVRAPLFAGRHT